MHPSNHMVSDPALVSWTWISSVETTNSTPGSLAQPRVHFTVDLLYPLRQWLDGINIRNAQLAHVICQLIPAQCPFERDIMLFGRTLLHIPPLCKLNPLYEQVVGLRFRALCYLADECGEDVTPYC